MPFTGVAWIFRGCPCGGWPLVWRTISTVNALAGEIRLVRIVRVRTRRGRLSIEGERRRQVAVGLDLRLQVRDLLLGAGNGICTGNKTARRRILAGNCDERSRELRWVA